MSQKADNQILKIYETTGRLSPGVIRKIVNMAADTDMQYTGEFFRLTKQAIAKVFSKNGHLCLLDPKKGKGRSYKEIQKLYRDEKYRPSVYSGQPLIGEERD